MVKSCSYGPCNSATNPKTKTVKAAPGIFFVRFPSLKTEREKCERWIAACGRKNFSIANINTSSYICSRHFEGFCGPTDDNPDPIPLLDVLTSNMIRIPTTDNESLVKKKHNLARKEISFDRQSVEMPSIEKPVSVSLNDLIPLRGWALEVYETRASYLKLQNSYKVIEVNISTFTDSEASITLMVLDKIISIEFINPNFVLKCNNNIYDLLRKIDQYCLCPGNPDEDFICLYTERKKFEYKSSFYSLNLNSIYSSDCQGLIKSSRKRCVSCSRFRSSLRTLKTLRKQKLAKKQTNENLIKP